MSRKPIDPRSHSASSGPSHEELVDAFQQHAIDHGPDPGSGDLPQWWSDKLDTEEGEAVRLQHQPNTTKDDLLDQQNRVFAMRDVAQGADSDAKSPEAEGTQDKWYQDAGDDPPDGWYGSVDGTKGQLARWARMNEKTFAKACSTRKAHWAIITPSGTFQVWLKSSYTRSSMEGEMVKERDSVTK